MKASFILTVVISTFFACGMSQRPYIYKNYHQYHHRQPPRRPTFHQNYQRFPQIPVQPGQTSSCVYNGQLVPNSQDIRQYSVCTRLKNSNLWFKHTYNCPSLTVFSTAMLRCMQEPSTTTTTESSLTQNNAQAPTDSTEVQSSVKQQPASSSSTPSIHIEIVTDPETSTSQIPTTIVTEVEMSSSSEEFMTHPPHFTRPDAESVISHDTPPVQIPWNPTSVPSTQKPAATTSQIVEQFVTSTKLPSALDPDYERLTFLNALQQNKLTNGIPQLSAAQRIPSDAFMNKMRTTSTSTVSPVTNSWPLSATNLNELATSTRFPQRWRPHLTKSSSLES